MGKISSITEICNQKLCVGCGVCAALCPSGSLEMRLNRNGLFEPYQFNKESCKHCSLCLEVCPGKNWKVEILEHSIETGNSNQYLGFFKNCYLGYSKNSKIREEAASGGLVTSILVHALSMGFISGAVITHMNPHSPLIPQSFLALSEKEIVEGAKSKYAPTHFSDALRQVMSTKGRFAFVGLPCHIRGLRKAQAKSSKLKNKIAFVLGLFCGHGVTLNFIRFLLKKKQISENQVHRVCFREGRWKQYGYGIYYNNSHLFVPFNNSLIQYLWCSFLFVPKRCLLCNDLTSECSDISFGDAWLPDLGEDNLGISVVISRSSLGEKILDEMKQDNAIHIEKTSATKIIESQKEALSFKKEKLNKRVSIFELFGDVPTFERTKRGGHGLKALIAALILWVQVWMVPFLDQIGALRLIPTKLFSFYHKVCQRIFY